MKVLDPQSALLTTAEVHHFLKSNKPRPVDKKIGAYKSVNVYNYDTVRKDVESYFQDTASYVLDQPPPEAWMTELVSKLKKYGLTKTEVFALINLGVGHHQGQSAAPDVDNGSADGVNGGEAHVKDDGESEKPDEEAVAAEGSELDRMLFGLVVEETDERFGGDAGEERIAEVLSILKETITGVKVHNEEQRVNGN